MLFIIEQLAVQGLLFFITLGETLFHLNAKVETPTEKEEPTLWGYNSLNKDVIIEEAMVCTPSEISFEQEPIVYTQSEMTLEQKQFFTSFFNPIVNSTEEDCSTNASIGDSESDMLTMAAWDEQPKPVEVSQRLSAKADSRIADQKIGEQLWVVEVFGEEQGYLHVSDGSARAWVEVAAYGTFGKGDILSMLVERTLENHVLARAVDLLQKNSVDFALEEDINDFMLHEEYDKTA